MNKKDRAKVAACFKAAKGYLAHTIENGPVFTNTQPYRYICKALDAIGDMPGSEKAKKVIKDRLGEYPSLEFWLHHTHQIELTEIFRSDTRMQATRHAWLDSLIEEFSC